jgi:hypothetical protein
MLRDKVRSAPRLAKRWCGTLTRRRAAGRRPRARLGGNGHPPHGTGRPVERWTQQRAAAGEAVLGPHACVHEA